MAALQLVARGETDAVAGGKQERRRVIPAEQPAQAGLVGLLVHAGSHLPCRLVGGKVRGQRLDQVLGAETGGGIPIVSDAEERGLAGQRPRLARKLARLGGHDRLRVAGVAVERVRPVEPEAAHGVLHVELILEAEGDLLGAGQDQQIVRCPGWVHRARLAARVAQPAVLGVAREVGQLAVVLPVAFARLFPAQRQQRRQRLPDRRKIEGVLGGEEDAPTGLAQVVRLDPREDTVGLAVLAALDLATLILEFG